ncbi:putative extracelular cellulose binding protein [Coprinopsis sp. MPI-PUGE-AT-0042]|nr:putative extracelular cellulose binding protein [Coprinopsis sp. MPI-PUGE-AT-0042]
MKTDVPNNGGFEEVRWVDWIVPELVPGTNPPPTSGTCQAPSNLALTSNSRFPNPFSFAGASKQVSTSGDWFCRRNELAGPLPTLRDWTYSPLALRQYPDLSQDRRSRSTSPENGQSISFTANVTYPAGASGAVPGIIAIGGLTVPNPGGVSVVVFDNSQIAGSTRGSGLFYQLYPNHAAGSLGATAWAVSRIIDALSSATSANVDVSRLAVTGCSDNGKAALVAGAFDQRIVLTIPVESGTGGAGCLRVADDLYKSGVGIVTAANLAGGALFSSTFSQYANQVAQLPFDHHLLAALVAPRGLLVLDNSQFAWLGPSSVYGCMTAAGKIYRSLGYADRLGISIVGGHDHCVFAGQQYPEFNAFINKFLRNNLQENTTVSKIDLSNNGGYDEAKYVDWSVPTLAS